LNRKAPLMLQISPGDPRSIGKQIVDGVRLQIAAGELEEGAQLPSVRGLALQLLINPNTVAKAYAELTAEGWLEARQGLGLFVARARQRLSDVERERRLNEAIYRFVNDVVGLDYSHREIVERLERELRSCAPRKTA
jgi:GntR family transcriptional regulator